MNLHFLGTGAADWTKKNGQGEFRCFSSTLIDEDLLIDVNGGALERIEDKSKIRTVLFTHSHSDHYNMDALRALAPCTVYAHESWAHIIDGEGLLVVPVKTGERFTLPDGTSVLPVPSNHSTARADETTVHYVIERGGKRLLYALDGAWLLKEAYALIRDMAFDAAVFDATIGEGYEDYRIFEHNSVPMVRLMADMMRKQGQLKPDTPIYLSHLARTLHPDQQTLETQCGDGLIPCYDGMKAAI